MQEQLAWDESKVNSKALVKRQAKLEVKKSSFCHVNALVSSREREKVSKVQKKSDVERRYFERRFW